MKTNNEYVQTSIFNMNNARALYGSFTPTSAVSGTLGAKSAITITKTFTTQIINSYEVWISLDSASAQLFKNNSTDLSFELYVLGESADVDANVVAERFMAFPNSLERKDAIRYRNEWIAQFAKNPTVTLIVLNRFDSPITLTDLEILRSQTVSEEVDTQIGNKVDTKVDTILSGGGQLATINKIDFFPMRAEAQYASSTVIWDYTVGSAGQLVALTRRSDGHVINITYN